MKKFSVLLTNRFQTHLMEIGDYIANDSPETALRWIEEIESAVSGLDTFPEGHPKARENDHHSQELRQLVYGKGRNKYRIIYAIEGNTVVVLDIRHGAREYFPEDDL